MKITVQLITLLL